MASMGTSKTSEKATRKSSGKATRKSSGKARRVIRRPTTRPFSKKVATKTQWLEVCLDPDIAVTPNVVVTPDPADADGKKVRWVEADDNENSFTLAGLDLDQTDWPNQKILLSKNRITSKNNGTPSLDFEYVIYVIHDGKLYDSIDRDADPGGGKPVIRNQ